MEKTAEAPPKAGRMRWLIPLLAAAVSGAVTPWLVSLASKGPPAHAAPEVKESRPAVLPFGDIIVNLGEERLTRYLRLKVLLVVDEKESKEVGELLTKQKAFLKSWAIGYLSDQSMQEVSRAAGVNRIRREMRDQFNAMLYPDGAEKIQDVLFDEFVVQ